jgi:hypothetical protein
MISYHYKSEKRVRRNREQAIKDLEKKAKKENKQ